MSEFKSESEKLDYLIQVKWEVIRNIINSYHSAIKLKVPRFTAAGIFWTQIEIERELNCEYLDLLTPETKHYERVGVICEVLAMATHYFSKELDRSLFELERIGVKTDYLDSIIQYYRSCSTDKINTIVEKESFFEKVGYKGYIDENIKYSYSTADKLKSILKKERGAEIDTLVWNNSPESLIKFCDLIKKRKIVSRDTRIIDLKFVFSGETISLRPKIYWQLNTKDVAYLMILLEIYECIPSKGNYDSILEYGEFFFDKDGVKIVSLSNAKEKIRTKAKHDTEALNYRESIKGWYNKNKIKEKYKIEYNRIFGTENSEKIARIFYEIFDSH